MREVADKSGNVTRGLKSYEFSHFSQRLERQHPISASALITSTGIGSGLNISAIVSSLTSGVRRGADHQLTNQQNTLDAQVSAYGTFTAALDTLQLALPALEDPSQLAAFSATVADKNIASANTGSDAVAGTYSLLVNNLATVATATSAALSSTAAVGTGTLTIAVGGSSTAITIDSTDNTLSGIAAAINSTPNAGVSASVIATTGGSRLVLTGTSTGAANQITVTPSGGDGGLASLALTTVAAQDANYTINGFAATSGSNVVANAVSGVTLDLQQASAPSHADDSDDEPGYLRGAEPRSTSSSPR